MIDNKKVIALIPARAGSKGIKNKNTKELVGKPLIVWTIEEAKKSRYIDEIFVSTDDKTVKNIALKYEIKVIDRPKHLATDTAKGIDVVLHALDFLEGLGYKDFVFLYLQPTSPLRTHKHIDEALELAVKKKKPVVSVCEACHPPSWMGILGEDNSMRDFLKALKVSSRQDEKKYYQLNGAIYIADNKVLKTKKNFLTNETIAYIMDKESSVDIDDEIDFTLAEALLKKRGC